jgi:hypothetical protein
MKRYFFVFLLSFGFSVCFSQVKIRGKVVTAEGDSNISLASANIGLFSKTDSVNLVTGTSTAEDGSFSIVASPDNYVLSVSYLGYETHFLALNLLELRENLLDVGDIVLKEDSELLSEIIVGAKRTQQNIDRKNVTFSEEQKKNAKDARDLMLNLPYLLVNKINNSLTTSDGKGVLILINGVKSNDSELKLIAVDKIKRVEYYDIPPIRYNVSGRVLNVVTKDFDSGFSGDFYLMAGQLYSMFTPYVSYVDGRHKFTFGADFFITPKRKIKDVYDGKYTYSLQDEQHEYAYQKENQNWSNQHNASFAYSNLKENDYIFQAKGIVGFTNDNSNETRNVHYSVNDIIDSKNGFLKNKVNTFSPVFDLYYSKKIKENKELIVNVVSSLYKNNQNIYSEEDGLFPFKDESDIETVKRTYIGEINYITNIARNEFSFGYKSVVSTAENKVTGVANDIKAIDLQEHSLYAETSGSIKGLLYRISVGGKLNTTKTSSGNTHLPTFTPTIILGHAVNDDNFLRLIYRVSTGVPEIQQFSDNSIMLMQNMIRKGNPDLKTSVNHDIRLNHSYSRGLLSADLSLFYQNDKNYMFDFFGKESINNKMFIALYSSNAAKNYKYGIETDLSIRLFNGLRIGGDIRIYNHYFMPTKNSIEINKYFIPVTLYGSYQYKNFLLDYYQKIGGNSMEGLYILGTEKVSYFNAGYSYKDWTFQLSYYFPFVKNKFKNYTTGDSIVQHTYEGWLRSKEKTVGLSVLWNFNTLIKPYRENRKLYNSDSDDGTFKLK